SAILWKPPAHSPEENMVRQKCSGIRRSYLVVQLAKSMPSISLGNIIQNISLAIEAVLVFELSNLIKNNSKNSQQYDLSQ
ncbi:hypothetical protein, partial [Serratia nevei]